MSALPGWLAILSEGPSESKTLSSLAEMTY